MYKKLMVIVFAVILSGLSVGSLVTMPKEKHPFSENENRYLASFPQFSLKNLNNKKFMDGFDRWTSDMFIGRERWISIKNNSERAAGKMEVAGTFTYKNRMIQAWEQPDFSETEKNLDAINRFVKRHQDIQIFFMLVPTSIEIYKDTLPKTAQNTVAGDMRGYISDCENYLDGVTSISVIDTLYQNRNEYIYYRTDHHWTSLGAYLSYLEIADAMDFTPLDIEAFEIEEASNDFRGTLYSKTLDKGIKPDIIDYYILTGGDPEATVEVLEAEGYVPHDSLYFRDYLDKKDKYASFLGQNTPIIKIKSTLENDNGKLLIFKDSYAHCLIPFLAKNWGEVTVLDMRYINVDYHQYINISQYNKVIFAYNAITFSEDKNIRKLNLAGKG